MQSTIKITMLIVSTFLITACGSASMSDGGNDNESGSSTAASQTSFYVNSAADLPTCDEGHKNALAYIIGESKFYGCDGSTWAAIDITGPAGPAGKDGTDNRITSSIYCSGDIGETSLSFVYNVKQMASGDIFANAEISGSDFTIGSVRFYSAKQKGAETASVIFVADFLGDKNYGWWNIELNRKTLIITATNHDNDATGGKNVWTMESKGCIVNSY